jgi:hypothetical protein
MEMEILSSPELVSGLERLKYTAGEIFIMD